MSPGTPFPSDSFQVLGPLIFRGPKNCRGALALGGAALGGAARRGRDPRLPGPAAPEVGDADLRVRGTGCKKGADEVQSLIYL